MLCIGLASASASEWAVDADGNWSVAGNWSGPIPDSSTATAQFGSAITSNRTVTLSDASDNNVTVGQITFDGHFGYVIEPQPDQGLTLAGNPIASLLLSGNIGNAMQTIDDPTVLSGVLITLPQDFILQNASSGMFTINCARKRRKCCTYEDRSRRSQGHNGLFAVLRTNPNCG